MEALSNFDNNSLLSIDSKFLEISFIDEDYRLFLFSVTGERSEDFAGSTPSLEATETRTGETPGNNEPRDLSLNPVSISFLGSSRWLAFHHAFREIIRKLDGGDREEERGRSDRDQIKHRLTHLVEEQRLGNFEMKLWVLCVSLSFYIHPFSFLFYISLHVYDVFDRGKRGK